jgi:hypothetical protein
VTTTLPVSLAGLLAWQVGIVAQPSLLAVLVDRGPLSEGWSLTAVVPAHGLSR